MQCINDPRIGRRVLLVYPRIPDNTYWSYSRALRLIGKKSILPPLGLLTVAAMLPEECELQLVDLNVEPLTEAHLAWAQVLFVSAMIVQHESLLEVVAQANAAGVPVVAGGPHPTTSYATLEGIDHFVLGEAEGLLDRFWSDYVAGRARRAYAAPVEERTLVEMRSFFGEDAVLTPAAERPDIDSTPRPRFDLLQLGAYKSMAVQASRGCPVGCEFCDIWRRYGRKPRCKSADRLLAELDELYRLGWRYSVFIVDDNFIGNKRRAKELCVRLAEWQRAHNRPFDFYTEATLTLADDEELLAALEQAGFDMVFIGIETPATESLKETRKHINTVGSMREKVRRIQARGIQVSAGFILGFDSDPADIADRMIDCIHDLGIPTAMVGLLMALPETDLHDRLQAEGRLIEGLKGNNTHEFSTNIRTKRPVAELVADYQRVLQAVYPVRLDAYFARCAVLREVWQAPDRPTQPVGWFDIQALVRYLVTAPFRSYRWSALRFLFETLVRKPAFFSVAVSLAIQGHHFREITRDAFETARLESYFAEQTAALRRTYQARVQGLRVSGQHLFSGFGARAEELWAQAGTRVRQWRQGASDLVPAMEERARQLYGETAPELLNDLLAHKDAILAEANRRVRGLRRGARRQAEARYAEFVREIETLHLQILCALAHLHPAGAA